MKTEHDPSDDPRRLSVDSVVSEQQKATTELASIGSPASETCIPPVDDTPPEATYLVSLDERRIFEDYVTEEPSAEPLIDNAASRLMRSCMLGGSYIEITPKKPPKARDYQALEFTESSDAANTPERSSHTTRIGLFRKLGHKKPPKPVIFKTVDNIKLAQLEAFFCACQQLLTPHQAPKARVIYEKGRVVGIYSEQLPDFKAIGTENISNELLAQYAKELARILMSALLLEEDDLHRHNFSLKYRIDFDGMFWPLMHRLKGKRFGTSPDIAFPITAEDLRHFPNIHHSNPFYWPTKNHPLYFLKNDYRAAECAAFASLAHHPTFINEKFHMLLKFVLLSSQQFSVLAKLHLDFEGVFDLSFIEQFEQHLLQRQQQVRQVLQTLNEFTDWLQTQGQHALDALIADVRTFNTYYKNDAYQEQRVSIEAITQSFHALVNECLPPHSTLAQAS